MSLKQTQYATNADWGNNNRLDTFLTLLWAFTLSIAITALLQSPLDVNKRGILKILEFYFQASQGNLTGAVTLSQGRFSFVW